MRTRKFLIYEQFVCVSAAYVLKYSSVLTPPPSEELFPPSAPMLEQSHFVGSVVCRFESTHLLCRVINEHCESINIGTAVVILAQATIHFPTFFSSFTLSSLFLSIQWTVYDPVVFQMVSDD